MNRLYFSSQSGEKGKEEEDIGRPHRPQMTRDAHWGAHPCVDIHTHDHTSGTHMGTCERETEREAEEPTGRPKSKANLVNIQMHWGRLSQLLLPLKKQMHQVRHCVSTSTRSPSSLSSFLLILLFLLNYHFLLFISSLFFVCSPCPPFSPP